MTLTPGQRRSWARHGAREIDRTIAEANAQVAAEQAERRAQLRQGQRTPRTSAVMPNVLPGDTVILWTGARITVGRVNRKSVTSTGGVRYTAGEITHVLPGASA